MREEAHLKVAGLDASLRVYRDAAGVAHVVAATEHDAWFGQGFVSAQDRLWQMEGDRRRAAGRWAEVVGVTAIPGDILARRLALAEAAKADVEAMSTETQAIFTAYADGVNAYIGTGQPLPPEFALTDTRPEPWEPWHSVALFKVRHVLMGTWQQKVAQAQLLAMIGPQRYGTLHGRPRAGSPTILPPGGTVARLLDTAADELQQAADALGFLAIGEGGSNSWAVHGSRTTSGRPVLCNDSHRALDVPSVYWQVHVAGPTFDVIGATFPGLPGFPHFGHNGHVAWNITHTSADYQDLYLEEFQTSDQSGAADQLPYRVPGGWATATGRQERIAVAGAAPVEIEVWRTRHGPIVHGDPRHGLAIALRYTATDGPCRAFETLRPMLAARSVADLHASQREWVDPVNNLVAADTAGSIGYLTRGVLPIRTSEAHRQFPAPGGSGAHEWAGKVPFDQLPRSIDPPEGFIATANQAVLADEPPYIAHDFSPPFRAARIVEGLTASDGRLTPEAIARLQGDTVSRAARAWVRRLARSGPFPTGSTASTGDGAERARALLAGWDGDLLPESAPALLYGHFRRTVGRVLFAPLVGEAAWAWLTTPESTTTHAMIGRWMVAAVDALEGDTTPDGRPWNDVLEPALALAWEQTVAHHGADPATWRWRAVHATAAQHPLATRFPEQAARLNPPAVAVGGDNDTLQAASYLWGDERPDFPIVSLSVYRQVVDLADIAHASYIIPGGVSGDPDSPHYADQLEHWRTHRRIPMHYTPDEVQGHAVSALTIAP